MVAVKNKAGEVIGHQPPYTKAEEFDLYTAMGGGKNPVSMRFTSLRTIAEHRAQRGPKITRSPAAKHKRPRGTR